MSETFKPKETTSFITGATHSVKYGVPNQISWWEYARKVRNIARNARINYPSATELAAIVTFINVICQWDDATQTYIGQRPELGYKYNLKSVSALTNYVGDSSIEPVQIIVKVLDQISRGLKQYPLNQAEITSVDILVSATEGRTIGNAPHYGGVIGNGIDNDR